MFPRSEKQLHFPPSTIRIIFTSLIVIVILIFDRFKNPPIGIYVISLRRSLERRESLRHQLSGLKYTVIDAYDGFHLSQQATALSNSYNLPKCLSPGEVGCFLSHLSLWETIARERYSHVLILEDDVQVNGSLFHFLGRVKTLENYDLLYLGHCAEQQSDKILAKINDYIISQASHPLCTRGYVITRAGCISLLSYMLSFNISLPVDEIMLDAYRNGYIRSASVFPPILSVKNFTPTIPKRGCKREMRI